MNILENLQIVWLARSDCVTVPVMFKIWKTFCKKTKDFTNIFFPKTYELHTNDESSKINLM